MKRITGICLTLLSTLFFPFVSAVQVYTWIDESGVTHFSETPPPDPVANTQLIDILPSPAPATAVSGNEDFYSVVNQADRMETRRLENEKLAAEKEQANAAATRARAEATAIQQGSTNYSASDNTRYYPVYPYYPRYGYHPGKPAYGYRPKPVHPVYPGHRRSRNPRTSLGKTPGMPR